jgi:two-component system response regulator WspF
MGRDGAQGLLQLRKAGFYTVAQDEASSAVYGMPKAAAQLGAASEILPLEKIAEALERWCFTRWAPPSPPSNS